MWRQLAFGLVALGVACGAAGRAPALGPFEAQVTEAAPIEAALAAAQPIDLDGATVTGLTVPHHRVASRLIASGMLTAARHARPSRIVVLTPDHFKRSPRPFATSARGFHTLFGTVPGDAAGARALLASPEVADSVLFEREHGIGELLPYLARLFPGVPVLPVAIRIGSTPPQWQRLIDRLAPLIHARTLIVQSTDFSHYLSREQADRHDQQTLNVLATGDPTQLALLRQPAHLDSRGAMFLQMRLQQRRFGARPIVFGHANSADDGSTSAEDTTSYIAQVFAAGAADRVIAPPAPARSVCLVGDTFFGRHVAAMLAEPGAAVRLRQALRARLRGCPLVVNLEGVFNDDGRAAHPMQLAMARGPALRWLRELGVVAASLANNHSGDLGDAARAATAAALRDAGITVLEHGQAQTVGPLRLTAWSDLDNLVEPLTERISLAALAAAPATDLAFLHWGREYDLRPTARDDHLAEALRQRGVPLVVGAHPHRASTGPVLLGGLDGLRLHSLGNFVFDQRGPRVSGAILQVSVFPRGLRAVRLVPLPDAATLARPAPAREGSAMQTPGP